LVRQGQITLKESQSWQQETKILQQEKELLEREVQSIKDLFTEKMNESADKIRSLEDEVKLSMEHMNSVVKERDRTNSEITMILKEKAEMASREVTLTQRIQELNLEVERAHNESKLKSELEIIKLQRDSLFEMIKQQENAMQLQQKQSESSLKMLHQRQVALDRYEQKYYHENDELNSLQSNLQKLLNHEGELLQHEVIDAKKLIGIITTMKEQVVDYQYCKDDLVRLENEKQEIYLKSQETERRSEGLMKEYRECSEQLEHMKKLSVDWETRAHYWQQVAKKSTSSGGGSRAYSAENAMNQSLDSTVNTLSGHTTNGLLDSSQLQIENHRLQESLNESQQQLEKTKLELESSKSDMQKEFSSLWLAVEQLNKLDASKDKNIHELIVERDNAVKECKEITKKYKEMKREYDGLQSELQVW
jgi:chromosome segregation ATPase